MKTTDFLNAIQQRNGLPSDYALSKFLGITKQAVSNYRHGKSFLDTDQAMKVAELLEMPPGYVLASIEAERADRMKKGAAGTAWRHAAALLRHGGRAAGLFLFALLIGNAQTAVEASGAIQAVKALTMYIMSTLRAATATLSRLAASLCVIREPHSGILPA